jgi:putative AdoMet-dependent methyltransferase
MTRPAWSFNEYQDFGFSDPNEIAAYEKKSGVKAEEERAFLLELGVSGQHTLLEMGSGTGILALEAAKLCKKVYAVDVSEAMLNYARSKSEQEGIKNIAFIHAGFLSYQHNGESVDFVVTRHALHHLPDFWKVQALWQIAGMLKPGGIFYLSDLVYSFSPQDTDKTITSWIDVVAREDGFSRDFFEEHVRQEYSTYSWLLEAMLEKTGFDIKEKRLSEFKTYAAYLCIKR